MKRSRSGLGLRGSSSGLDLKRSRSGLVLRGSNSGLDLKESKSGLGIERGRGVWPGHEKGEEGLKARLYGMKICRKAEHSSGLTYCKLWKI